MARGKTLAMHVLDGRKVPYQVIEFPESIHEALGVAAHAGLPPETVYKTLVVQALDTATQAPLRSHKPLLILVAATRTLDPKKVAAALGLKRVGMARQQVAERLTGLKVGGISALALLNRGFEVYIDEPAMLLDEVVVSAGQRGLNLRLAVADLLAVSGARWLDAGRPSAEGPPQAPGSPGGDLDAAP
jgi:Cys-tRNA(Pro)/Cys-tRNA(Cys) deacylase